MGEVGSQFRGGGTAISRWDEQEEAAWRDVGVWNGQVGRSVRRRMYARASRVMEVWRFRSPSRGGSEVTRRRKDGAKN